MGAWGFDTFDNDEACDWASDLAGTHDLSLITQAIQPAAEEDVDSHMATHALAACEAIARLQGNGGERNAYTEDLDKWVESHPQLQPPADLVRRAHAAIDRILGESSELRELWDESDEGDSWRAAVESLRSRLKA